MNYNAMLNHLGEKEDRGKIRAAGRPAGRRHRLAKLILYVGLIGERAGRASRRAP